ncbi:MAG: phytoene desaturase family protein [Actinomycetota bacterium]
MSERYDAVVIGGGHNGLVAAASLARARRRVLVLERSLELGGTARTVEVAPGFRAPALLHTMGELRRSVIRDLELERHGLRLIRPGTAAFVPEPDGGGVVLHADPRWTADGLRARSARDAEAYPAFDARIRSLASFMAHVAAATPPDIEEPSLRDAFGALRLGRALRRIGKRAGREALRVLPMPVADLVGDAFETEGLRAGLASRAVALTAMGPWTPGTAMVFLLRSTEGGGAAGATAYAAGGPAALVRALEAAARSAGAEVRTGVQVVAVTTRDGRAIGVALSSGEEIEARAVVSSADPKRTLSLLDPVATGPTLLWRGRNIRTPGSAAVVTVALDGFPAFRGVDDPRVLAGRIVIGPSIDHLERAADDHKYGRVSEAPFLEATIPSLADPTLAPEGSHVMSVLFHSAPYHLRDGGWDQSTGGHVGDLALKALEEVAPGLSDRVVARRVSTPADLERDLALTEGCAMHAEPGLDQFFSWRPLLGHARYRFAIPGLYLAGSGAHPGGGLTGAPGVRAAREVLTDLKRSRS